MATVTNHLTKAHQLIYLPSFAVRGIHTTSSLSRKHLRAGVVKLSKTRPVPLTYEQAKGPYDVGVKKSWLSWNTSNLAGERRQAETLMEDAFIRKFIHGTWPEQFVTDIVIKRRFNTIIVAGFIQVMSFSNDFYFLLGYTEEMLSLLMKCPVKMELQTVDSVKDSVFKYK